MPWGGGAGGGAGVREEVEIAIYETETSGKHYDGVTAEVVLTAAGAKAPPEPPFLVAVNDRLDRLGKLIDEGRSMAAVLRERTMGPCMETEVSPKPLEDMSEFGRILGRLDHLISQAVVSAGHVGALAARI